ncbi:MAG: aspartoacylase [Acidobacteria bacterium]|nr:aspartoacylase [Acidobacteriota bacterium]
MSSTPSPDAAARHRIGIYDQGEPGPTILVMSALHGNEPAGFRAFERVYERLLADKTPFRGRLVGFVGNLTALDKQQRFIDEDLNRIWQPGDIARRAAIPWEERSSEGRQQAELLAALEGELGQASNEPIYFLDLHTSSAQGKPFVCIGDTLRNRNFATQFPVPVILGLEEQVDGAMLEYVNNLGHVTVGVEAGQHDDPTSIDFHEAFVSLALVGTGCVHRNDLSCYNEMRARLDAAGASLPRVLEVRHRHPVSAADDFQMRPGYENFQPVKVGEELAQDARGAVQAPETGRVLLPLYQGQGDDGYFLVREFAKFWLAVSALLRRLKLGRCARWLPGVHVHHGDANTLVVNRGVARWFTVEIFHLLGYRKERSDGDQLLFSRRVEDF